MSFRNAIRIEIENLRSLAAGGIGANYAAIGTALENPCRMIRIQNLTDATILVSDDGVNDKEIFVPGSFLILDIATNRTNVASEAAMAQGKTFYAKQSGAAPTTGSIYISSYYGAP